jgi:uncharacterized protein DUF6188
MTARDTAEAVLGPLVGQMAWQVRSDEHGCIMLEFGAPHLDVREPVVARKSKSPKAQRALARRAVRVMGDWHLWVQSCNWTLRTGTGVTSSRDETENWWQDWMDDVTGQQLVSVSSPQPGALELAFEMGALLEVKPDAGGELDSWSLFPWEGSVVTCNARGVLTTEARQD